MKVTKRQGRIAHHLCIAAAMPPFRTSWLYLVPPFTLQRYEIFPFIPNFLRFFARKPPNSKRARIPANSYITKETKDAPVVPSKSYGSSSSYRHEEKEPDNMRGFDPASEDDMEDNGMSRYMENNDEEGWY